MVISASHNAYGDNGIKFFAPGGLKLTDAVEEALEAELDRLAGRRRARRRRGRGAGPDDRPTGSDDAGRRGRRGPLPAGGGRPRWRAATWTGSGVVIDCANGAASFVAPPSSSGWAPTGRCIHAEPDGRNINHGCGSTHPGDLQAAVVAAGADAGPGLRR